jgi:hypothetical protein
LLSLSDIAEDEWAGAVMASDVLPEGYGVAATPWPVVQIAARAAVKQAP